MIEAGSRSTILPDCNALREKACLGRDMEGCFAFAFSTEKPTLLDTTHPFPPLLALLLV